jgi:hypothetical protein
VDGVERLVVAAGGWPVRVLIALLVAITFAASYRPALGAAPALPVSNGELRAQNVGWLSSEAVAEFAGVQFSVLVPTAVPAPFGGEPAIDASSGAYSLYWMIPGGEPTFLHIEGIAGGALPEGSPNDLNIPLEINADVGGSPAIHDVTEIYDNVWWKAGGVLYSISGRNSSADSLSLANALIPLVVPEPVEEEPVEEPEPPEEEPAEEEPAEEEPVEEPAPEKEEPVQEDPVLEEEPVEEGPVEEPATTVDASLFLPEVVGSGETTTVAADGVESATLVADDGVFSDTGTATYSGMRSWDVFWQAPTVSVDTTVGFTLLDPVDDSVLASGQLIVVAPQPSSDATVAETEDTTTESPAEEDIAEPDTEGSVDTTAEPVATETGPVGVRADVPTDGTDGPSPPVFGSDGTGGIKHVSVANGEVEEP